MICSIDIDVPDSGWFETDCYPLDKELCIVLTGWNVPKIMQWRASEGMFLDVDGIFNMIESGYTEWEPGWAGMNILKYWKHLLLPPEEDERLCNKIDSWFDNE